MIREVKPGLSPSTRPCLLILPAQSLNWEPFSIQDQGGHPYSNHYNSLLCLQSPHTTQEKIFQLVLLLNTLNSTLKHGGFKDFFFFMLVFTQTKGEGKKNPRTILLVIKDG